MAVGQFKYRLALDPRLLARIIDEAPDVHSKIEALRKWCTYANKRLEQIRSAPVSEWEELEDGTIGAFILKGGPSATPWGPIPEAVCGVQNSRDGLICPNPRGQGTNHPGYGSCYTCEMKSSSALWRSGAIYSPGNEKMIFLNRSNNLPARLRECLDVSEAVEEKTLRAIDGDLRTTYGLVQFILEGGLHRLTDEEREAMDWLSPEDIKTCNMLLKTALEAKKIAYLMEKDAKLDPVTIKSFVGQVMAVVFANVEPNTARRIGGEILDQVIRPFKMEGRISGDDTDYSDIGPGMAKAIGNYAGVDAEDVSFSEVEGEGSLSGEDLSSAAKEAMNHLKSTRKRLEKKTRTSTGGTLDSMKEQEKKEKRRARRRTNRKKKAVV